MAESICRALRDGALEGEHAPTLTIKDSLDSPFAFDVFSSILVQLSSQILRGNSQSRGIVIVAVSRSPSSYISFLKTKGVDIESSQKWIHILDCYTDPLGWKDTIRKSRNVKDIPRQSSLITSSYKAMKDLEKLFSLITELGGGLVEEKKARFCVAVDSLSELLRHTTSQSVSGFLSNLRSHDQISCIFGLLHSDLHDDRVAAALDYMSSMAANVEPFHHSFNGQRGNSENSLSERSFTRGKFNVRFKRRNGRVRVMSEEFKVDPDGISFTSVSSVDGVTSVSGLLPKVSCIVSYMVWVLSLYKRKAEDNLLIMEEKVSSLLCKRGIKRRQFRGGWGMVSNFALEIFAQELWLQFNLQLSEKERTDRAKVVLPFEHQGNGRPIQIYDGRRSLEDFNAEARQTFGGKKGGSDTGEIIYYRDSDDEMPDSDEDPDDDLDI